MVNFVTNWVFWYNVEKTFFVLFPDDSRVDDIFVWIRRVAVGCFENADVFVEEGVDGWTTGDGVVDELAIKVVDEVVDDVDRRDTKVFVEVVKFFNGWEDKAEFVNIEEKEVEIVVVCFR